MKERLFGLKKAPINKFIKNMEWDFLSEKVRLEYELENILKENENINQQIQQKSKFQSLQFENEELWAIGKERMANVIQHLSKQKEIEMATIRKHYSTKSSLIKQQIEEVELEIILTEEMFSKMIKQLSNVVKQSEDRLLYPNSPKNLLNEPDILEEVNKEEYKLEDKEIIKESSSNHTSPIIADDNNIDEIDLKIKKQNEQKNINPMKSNESFWDEVESLSQTKEYGSDDYKMDTQWLVPEQSKTSHQSVTDTDLKPSEIPKTNPTKTKNTSMENTVATIEVDLIEQIDQIKSQYIVGKVSGTDLYDFEGRLIIAKSTLISKDVVERANRAGKLAELIVNMKLSTTGDE